MTTIIVAESLMHALQFAKDEGFQIKDWLYAADRHRIAGLRGFTVIYHGNWTKHPHAKEIHEQLMLMECLKEPTNPEQSQ